MDRCKKCQGLGILIAFNTKREHYEIERCDKCKVFASDELAWKYLKPNMKSTQTPREEKGENQIINRIP